MLCSTIIPTVNRPSLERAVKSVIEQDLDPQMHEIIVVNDSGEPLPKKEWLKSSYIKIVNTNRCERSVACNVGAAVASGRYLKFLHDDDCLLPGALRTLISIAESSGCAWVHGVLNRVDDAGRFISLNKQDIRGNIFAYLVAGETIHLGASLIERHTFFQIGGFDPNMKTAEDRDLECRIALISEFDRTDNLIANIRVGEGGISTTDWSKATEESRIIREKALDAPGALARMLNSIKGDVHLRGRCCRAYILSALLNLRAGRLFMSCSRIFPLVRVAGFYTLLPSFWRGLFYRTYWYSIERQREEQHYAKYSLKKSAKLDIK
jgi:glycosyltransferase involved in cell wall biosynthesis